MKKRLIYIGLFFWLLFSAQFVIAKTISIDSSDLGGTQFENRIELGNSDLS